MPHGRCAQSLPPTISSVAIADDDGFSTNQASAKTRKVRVHRSSRGARRPGRRRAANSLARTTAKAGSSGMFRQRGVSPLARAARSTICSMEMASPPETLKVSPTAICGAPAIVRTASTTSSTCVMSVAAAPLRNRGRAPRSRHGSGVAGEPYRRRRRSPAGGQSWTEHRCRGRGAPRWLYCVRNH